MSFQREEYTFLPLDRRQVGRVADLERESFSNPWSPGELRHLIQDRHALCLGVWRQGELIGYGMGLVEGVEFHLVNLAVASRFRRRGWGTLLLERLLADAYGKGCRRCILEVRASNRGAIALYRKYGFEETSVRSGYYRNPREDALVMRRTIEGI